MQSLLLQLQLLACICSRANLHLAKLLIQCMGLNCTPFTGQVCARFTAVLLPFQSARLYAIAVALQHSLQVHQGCIMQAKQESAWLMHV